MAPKVGVEPTTDGLTVRSSTSELLGNKFLLGQRYRPAYIYISTGAVGTAGTLTQVLCSRIRSYDKLPHQVYYIIFEVRVTTGDMEDQGVPFREEVLTVYGSSVRN